MRIRKVFKKAARSIFSGTVLLLIFTINQGVAQVVTPGRNDILTNKISAVVATSYIVQNEKSKKRYVDSVMFDMYGVLVKKHITAYDTTAERELAGDWAYTYDSVGNRKLETRKSADAALMDYYNYVYDSNRITKQIWVYWTNLKHIFDRIYEVKYDGYGRLSIEKIEEGNEKLDSIFSFNYDSSNRLNNIVCSSNLFFKDTMNVVTYIYNTDGTVAQKITNTKGSKSIEEFAYDQNRRTIKHSSDEGTTTYIYDKNGLLISSEMIVNGKKGMKYKYTYNYIYR